MKIKENKIPFFPILSAFLCLQYLLIPIMADDFSHQEPDDLNARKVKSVQLFRHGWRLSYPIIELNGSDKLELCFDVLGNESENFSYTIVHCDADWRETNLAPSEYIDGFYEDQITDYSFSFNTKIPYTHYKLLLPNENLKPKLSGNYLLIVYDSFNKENIILKRAFYIYEPMIGIEAKVKRPMLTEYRDKGQEIDFSIDYSGYSIDDPYQEIRVIVSQNGRFDNEIRNLKPLFVRPSELDYNYNEENIFMGGSEFRYFDIKSLRYQSEYIRSIEFKKDRYVVTLFPEDPRPRSQYFYREDLNGKYYIDIQEEINSDTDADYVEVNFSLNYGIPEIDGDIYVFGALSNWEYRNANKMTYNFDEKKYELTLLLKQGYYNYHYMFLPNTGYKGEYSLIEGNHYETENDYIIRVYHKSHTSRYEKLIGVQVINSLHQK